LTEFTYVVVVVFASNGYFIRINELNLVKFGPFSLQICKFMRVGRFWSI